MSTLHMPYSELAKHHCIHSQLLPLQMTDTAVLNALNAIPRDAFLPDSLAGVAYIDEDIPIGHGRHLIDLSVFARLVSALAIQPDEVVLDIGCATGYSTAVLAQLALHVIAIEERRDLASITRQNLKATGAGGTNTEVLTSALTAGCTLMSPYGAILLGGAVEAIPPIFFEKLAPGGRLATVEIQTHHTGDVMGVGHAVLYRKEQDNSLTRSILFDASVALLPGFEKKTGFVF